MVSGYYQVATMVMRDLLETAFLLLYFRRNPDTVARWRVSDEKTRQKHFGPVIIRKALGEKDGFTGNRRASAYKLLCELAAHPTYKGFVMLAPRGQDHHCGPFFDHSALKALIEELAKLASQAAQAYTRHFKPNSMEHARAKIAFSETWGLWAERYWGLPYDRAAIQELKDIAAEIENGGGF